MTKARNLYDERYTSGYRAELSSYEIARWVALRHFVTEVAQAGSARSVLDYGAGRGLHVSLWQELFPTAELSFCDLSPVALGKLGECFPEYAARCHVVEDGRAALGGKQYDVVVSVEVMEHVEDLDAYLRDIHRALVPGGRFIWTTPCANRLSVEHVYSWLSGQIEPTKEGYRRWKWEDPTHLRRMTTNEARQRLLDVGFSEPELRFRAHLFSFVCSQLPTKRLTSLRNELMKWDYGLFRRLRNGASMIGVTRKLDG